jgi:hypothetical protein
MGYGNSENLWNSINETQIHGQLDSQTVPPVDVLDSRALPIVDVQASDAQAPNMPANTTDGDMNTRWSVEGDGQWIMYDIGSLATVNEVANAWLKGDQRKSSFAIDVSVDGKAWNKVFSSDSSGTTNDYETYILSPVAARYVRIMGYGNSENLWNSINETEVYGSLN